MLYLFAFCVFACAGVAFWFCQQWLGRYFVRYRSTFKTQASQGLSEMFLFLDPTQVWFASLCLCGATATLAYVLGAGIVPAVVAGGVTLMMPRYALARARRRRLERLDQQLPDLLLGLAGALRAGSGIQSSLRHLADHTPEPLSQELGLMLREQRMGVSFEQALNGFYRRVPTEGTSLVVSALNIAGHSGGSLAETLERIASTLRGRLHLLGRVRALTSQGRMQAWVMASLPMGLALVLHGLDPQAMSALWHTSAGWSVLIVIAVLEATGIYFIRRIVNIEI